MQEFDTLLIDSRFDESEYRIFPAKKIFLSAFRSKYLKYYDEIYDLEYFSKLRIKLKNKFRKINWDKKYKKKCVDRYRNCTCVLESENYYYIIELVLYLSQCRYSFKHKYKKHEFIGLYFSFIIGDDGTHHLVIRNKKLISIDSVSNISNVLFVDKIDKPIVVDKILLTNKIFIKSHNSVITIHSCSMKPTKTTYLYQMQINLLNSVSSDIYSDLLIKVSK